MTHFTVAKCGGADKAENWAVGMTSENEKMEKRFHSLLFPFTTGNEGYRGIHLP